MKQMKNGGMLRKRMNISPEGIARVDHIHRLTPHAPRKIKKTCKELKIIGFSLRLFINIEMFAVTSLFYTMD